jgi:uncharacterized membrane protein YeiH
VTARDALKVCAKMQEQFSLPIIFDLGATFIFGITGALAALQRGYDFIGLFALAFASGVGGGLLRDGLFIQQGPPAVTMDSRYIVAITVASLFGLLFRHGVTRLTKVIALVDALGLGAYAVVGVEKSISAGLSIPAAVLVGVINAVGGGLLRDLLVRDEPLLLKPGQFYALAALGGCLLFFFLTMHFGMPAPRAALITIACTFVVRVLAITFNWRTKSLYRPETSEEEPKR